MKRPSARQRTTGAALTLAFAFSMCLVVSPSSASATSTWSFSRAGAIKYANKYETARNSTFPSYDDNCTNYASQVWNLGGNVPIDFSGDHQWYYQASNPFYATHSWKVATDFRDYWYYRGGVVDYLYDYDVTNPFNKAYPGDAIIYSKGDNGDDSPNFHHTGIEHHWDSKQDYEIQNTVDEVVPWNTWYKHSTPDQQKWQRYWGYRMLEPKYTDEGY